MVMEGDLEMDRVEVLVGVRVLDTLVEGVAE